MTEKRPIEPVHDLTTPNGLALTAKALAWLVLPPGPFLIAKAVEAVVGWLGSPSEVSPQKQAEAAEKVIEAGRRNDAKKIKFKVDKDVGARLKGNVKGNVVVVDAGIGVDGKMELEVEYK